MSWGFERGRIYNRRTDIHGRFSGQQQGGIITPASHRLVIIITGEEGLAHGYSDRQRPDGVFEYFGEGQVGDMPFVRGNLAIRDHWLNGRDLLLFRKLREGYRFEGDMVFADYHYEDAPDRNGDMRKAIVFELRPLEAVEAATALLPVHVEDDLSAMRAAAFDAAKTAPSTTQRTVNIVERSRKVRDYVVARAKGSCEGCEEPAPFLTPAGVPYLEPHHIRRLADGGPDDPRFVIALCPTCHRHVHFGENGPAYNNELLDKMLTIEKVKVAS